MALIGLLVMAIGGAAVWYWRLKMMREAGSEIIDTVEKMRGAYKRRSFRKKAEIAPIASIRDPAIAAVAFFMCLANEKPMHVEAAKLVVRDRMKNIIASKDMEEVIVFGEWASKNVVNPEDPIRRFRHIWANALDVDERLQLIDIADEVAQVGGEKTSEQELALQALRRTLLN
ncbi:hypothetical protein HRR99_11390 [Agrobacterium vaccinii]|uniref:hypothetical protein n=1 Tax=Agrobacterium vaccinii TaxID=2735528 RepID=UPI001E5BD643|nr:hypothetical protein [Agrobacterium vaccinii]UHS62079.1 hypothetical protein HRR99_11390 [Agrobacterium vaccinii]